MILIQTDKNGLTIELYRCEIYEEIVLFMDSVCEKKEERNVFLIKKEVMRNLSRNYEFATKTNGWECVLMLVNDYAKNIF